MYFQSFKKAITYKKFKDSVSHSVVKISLMLSTGAEINCFEKVGVFGGGKEWVINFGFYNTNIGVQYWRLRAVW